MGRHSTPALRLRGLMEELVKETPNLEKARLQARRLGMSGKGDIVEIMAEALRQAEKMNLRTRHLEEVGK